MTTTQHTQEWKIKNCFWDQDGDACFSLDGIKHLEKSHWDLIAAAPKLLEALEIVLNSDMAMREEDEGKISPTLQNARAIIALAKGDK